MKKITIRDAIAEDAKLIFDLRRDPRLRGMQYPLTPVEHEDPASLRAESLRPELPENGWKCTTILADREFAGYIIESFTTSDAFQGNAIIDVGWDLVPKLWGKGFMVDALGQLFDSRFELLPNVHYIARCFASNHRCLRVIQKLGFKVEQVTLGERMCHFLTLWSFREELVKHRLTRDLWRTQRTKP